MVTAILPDVETPIKPLPSDRIDSHPDWQSQSTRDGSIVIRLGLDGIQTVQIIADGSTEEEELWKLLTAAHPVIEQLHAVVRGER